MTTDTTQAVMFHGRAPEDRDPGAEVMRTWRAVSLAAAGTRPRLPPVEYAVLLAVHGLVVSWTRLWDELYVADVAIVAGLTTKDGQPDAKECGRRLRSLAQRGLIVYQPSTVKGRPSRVGMPAVTTAGTLVRGGQAAPPKPAPADAVRGGQAAPPKPRNRGGQATPLYTGGVREVPPPADSPPTQAAIMVVVPGGGGSTSPTEDTPTESVAARTVLDVIATAMPLRAADRAALADPIDRHVTDGWDPQVLAAHLTADPPPGKVTQPGGWLAYRLTGTHKATGAPVLPESPAVCACSACRRHVRQAEAEIRRQTAELDRARQRKAVQADDAGRRQDEITEALGSVLHGRIVAAELARLAQPAPGVKNPGVAPGVAARAMTASLARSPARIRALVAGVYLEHHYELDAVRAYAESLPTGPTETAPADGDSPTGPAGPIVRLRHAQGA